MSRWNDDYDEYANKSEFYKVKGKVVLIYRQFIRQHVYIFDDSTTYSRRNWWEWTSEPVEL